MSTQKQIEANRRNARKSTGPKTPEGKARSAQNSIKHGLLSRQVVLADEDEAEFNELRINLYGELAPEGQLEGLLVNRIAAQQWRLARIPALEAELIDHLRDDLVQGDLGLAGAWAKDSEPYGGALSRLARYETMLERSTTRLLAELRRLQAERRRREREDLQRMAHEREARAWESSPEVLRNEANRSATASSGFPPGRVWEEGTGESPSEPLSRGRGAGPQEAGRGEVQAQRLALPNEANGAAASQELAHVRPTLA